MIHLEKLRKCLDKIGAFSEEELTLVYESAVVSKFKKNEVILNTGQVCNSFYFILSGACYQYQMVDIEEKIIDLFTEYDCALNQLSFISQKPSNDIIKAFTDCEILVLNIDSVHKLIKISNSFLQFGKLMNSQNRLVFFDNSMSPVDKYNHILINNPIFIQTFPLKYIASFLKITPETLSRVRAL